MAFPATQEKEKVREGEAEAKKAKGKKKKDTEIEQGGTANEGVTKANRSSMPALDDENNDACAKKDGKGKDCGCEHKNDSLTPQEYIAACNLGIQDRSRVYIRARLDAAERLDLKASSPKGQKCGNSYIPKGNKCHNGVYAGGSKDPASIRRGVTVGGKAGLKIGAGVGAVSGAIGGYKTGGITGALVGGALGGLTGAGQGVKEGVVIGAGFQAARKVGRAYGRSAQNNRRIQQELKGMKQGKNESHMQFAARLGHTVENQTTNVWSTNNEFRNQSQFKKKRKKKDTESVWADGFGKFDAESALSANAMNLATDKYSNEKRKKHAQGQPRNIIYANTFNT